MKGKPNDLEAILAAPFCGALNALDELMAQSGKVFLIGITQIQKS